MSSNIEQSIKFDSQPPLPLVIQAIHSLYHDPDKTNKENADKWLKELKNTLYAWKIADELLISKADQESCYFAAQILKTKIQYNFNELPAEAYISLKDSILNHLKSFQTNSVQTQLALGITYLAILAPSWQNPVEELVNHDLDKTLLIEILTFFSEELDQSRKQSLKGVGQSRRQQFTQYLSKISPLIINLLNTTLQEAILIHQTEQTINNSSSTTSGTEKLIAKIYRCLGAWIVLIDAKEIDLIGPILNYLFESLKDPELSNNIHDAAADTICGAALLCENYPKYQQLTHYLLNQIYQLENIYQHSVSNEDIDKSVNYSRIFTEMAESVVSPLIVDVACQSNNYDNIPALKIIDLVLHCIAHYDYEVAEITFHFWFRFTELIDKRASRLLPLFVSISNKLILGLIRHCQLECDQEGLLSNDSSLYSFRLRVRDLIKEVIFIVGAQNYIHQNNIIRELETNLIQLSLSSSNINWEEVEAQLFILSCIVADINEDDQLVSSIVKLVLQTQKLNLHCQIYATNCTILGELNVWLENQHEFIDPVLNYLLAIITNSNLQIQNNDVNDVTLASFSANSLQKIVGSSSYKDLVGNIYLINALIDICSQLDTMANEAANNLLHCCSAIISANGTKQLTIEEKKNKEELVVRLLKPSVDSLSSIVCSQQNKNKTCVYLDRISSVFKNLKFSYQLDEMSLISQLCTQQLWPLIENLLNQTIRSDNVTDLVEKSCRCLKNIIRFLKPIWLLKPIANTIVNLYQANPKYSTYLYLASVLVDEFGSTTDLEISNGLIYMLNAFCMSTFTLLAQDSKLVNHPDTIDDFFRLCSRFLQKNPENFLTNSMLESILNLTIASITLDHRDANKSVCKFIDEFLSCSKFVESNVCDEVLKKMLIDKNFGQQLLQTVILAALIHLPSHYNSQMSDIVWKINKWDNKQMQKWLQIILSSFSNQVNIDVNVVEPSQLEEFYNNLVNANNPKMIAVSLNYLSRLLN